MWRCYEVASFLEYREMIDVIFHGGAGRFEESAEFVFCLVVLDIGNRAEALVEPIPHLVRMLKAIDADHDFVGNRAEDCFTSLRMTMFPVSDCFASGGVSGVVSRRRISRPCLLIEHDIVTVVNRQRGNCGDDPESVTIWIEGLERDDFGFAICVR